MQIDLELNCIRIQGKAWEVRHYLLAMLKQSADKQITMREYLGSRIGNERPAPMRCRSGR